MTTRYPMHLRKGDTLVLSPAVQSAHNGHREISIGINSHVTLKSDDDLLKLIVLYQKLGEIKLWTK